MKNNTGFCLESLAASSNEAWEKWREVLKQVNSKADPDVVKEILECAEIDIEVRNIVG